MRNPILWIVYLARFGRSSFWIINIEPECNAMQCNGMAWYGFLYVRARRAHTFSQQNALYYFSTSSRLYICVFETTSASVWHLKQTKTQNQHKIVYRMKLCIQKCHKRNTFSSQIKQCIRAAKHEH